MHWKRKIKKNTTRTNLKHKEAKSHLTSHHFQYLARFETPGGASFPNHEMDHRSSKLVDRRKDKEDWLLFTWSFHWLSNFGVSNHRFQCGKNTSTYILVSRHESTCSLIKKYVRLCQTLSLEHHILQQPTKKYSMLAHIFSFQPESCYVVKSGTSQTTYLQSVQELPVTCGPLASKGSEGCPHLIYFLWVKSMWVFEEMIQKCKENSIMICPFW